EKGKKEASSNLEKETILEVQDILNSSLSLEQEQEEKISPEQKMNVAVEKQYSDAAASIAPAESSLVSDYDFRENNIQMNEAYNDEKYFTEKETSSTKGFLDHVKNSFNHATGKINASVDEEGEVRLDIKEDRKSTRLNSSHV